MNNQGQGVKLTKRSQVGGIFATTFPDDPWHEVELRRLHDFVRWSEGWKRRLGFTAGLTLLELRKDHYGDPPRKSWALMIASRHWPHLLCWQWLLQLRPQRGMPWEKRRFFHFYRSHSQWTLRALWLLDLHWHVQHSDWMVAEPFRSQAPQLYPLHEGEARTMPAGRAALEQPQ